MVAVEFLLFFRLMVPKVEVPRGIKLTGFVPKVVVVMVKPAPMFVRLLVCAVGGGSQVGALMV
jgi:hypothetical protein